MDARDTISAVASPPWPGWSGRGSLVLPLGWAWLESLPGTREVDGIALRRKHEVHLTLLDRHEAARVRAHCDEAGVRAVFEALDWRVETLGECWLLREPAPEHDAFSLVELVHAPGLAAFRQRLGDACGVDLPHAPAHVTTHLAATSSGIGLPDHATFRRLRVRCVPPAGAQSS